MKANFALPLLLFAVLSGSGCKTVRNIEQWKCDNWGLCHFGIKPTPRNRPHAHSYPLNEHHSGNHSGHESGSDCGCNPPPSELQETQTQSP